MKNFFKNQKGFSHHLLVPIIVVLVIAAIGGYLLLKGNAEELPAQSNHVQVVDQLDFLPNATGIKHNTADGVLLRDNQDGCNCYIPAWRVSLWKVSDHYEWYGPGTQDFVVHSNRQGVRECWWVSYFTSDSSKNINLGLNFSFDLFYNGHSHGADSEPLLLNIVPAGTTIPFTTICHNTQTGPTTLHNIEARVKVHLTQPASNYKNVYLDISSVIINNYSTQ